MEPELVLFFCFFFSSILLFFLTSFNRHMSVEVTYVRLDEGRFAKALADKGLCRSWSFEEGFLGVHLRQMK